MSELSVLLQRAGLKGYTVVHSGSDATVVLYGQGGAFSHAIKRVGREWYEVSYLGGPLCRYTGAEDPPARHDRDGIVAMLKKRS